MVCHTCAIHTCKSSDSVTYAFAAGRAVVREWTSARVLAAAVKEVLQAHPHLRAVLKVRAVAVTARGHGVYL